MQVSRRDGPGVDTVLTLHVCRPDERSEVELSSRDDQPTFGIELDGSGQSLT